MMEPVEYEVMHEVEDSYWWFVARRSLVKEWLRKTISRYDKQFNEFKILDVGCGTGANSEMLKTLGTVYCLDMYQDALLRSRQRNLKNLTRSWIENICYLDNSFDFITALDVLEHVSDDNKGAAELYRICKPGGFLLVTVPAYNFLWSEHDEALHHKRRYVANQLSHRLTEVGFKVERISYFISLLFLPISVVRLWQNLFKNAVHPKTTLVLLPKFINLFLIWLLTFEKLLVRYINLPFGLSIICLARKPLS